MMYIQYINSISKQGSTRAVPLEMLLLYEMNWETRLLQSACLVDSLINYSQTAACVKLHVIITEKRGIHRPPVTKKLTQYHLYQGANVLPKFFYF